MIVCEIEEVLLSSIPSQSIYAEPHRCWAAPVDGGASKSSKAVIKIEANRRDAVISKILDLRCLLFTGDSILVAIEVPVLQITSIVR